MDYILCWEYDYYKDWYLLYKNFKSDSLNKVIFILLNNELYTATMLLPTAIDRGVSENNIDFEAEIMFKFIFISSAIKLNKVIRIFYYILKNEWNIVDF